MCSRAWHELFELQQRPTQVDHIAAQLQVNMGVPELFSLLRRKLPFLVSLSLCPVDELEDVIVPEDRVFDELPVSDGANSTAVLVH